ARESTCRGYRPVLVQKHGSVDQIQQTKTKTTVICELAATSEVAQIQTRIQKILFGGIAKFGGGVTSLVNCIFISAKLNAATSPPPSGPTTSSRNVEGDRSGVHVGWFDALQGDAGRAIVSFDGDGLSGSANHFVRASVRALKWGASAIVAEVDIITG